MSATIISVEQGNNQTVEPLFDYPTLLKVKVRTGLFQPLPNEIVWWTVPQVGPSGHFTGDHLIYDPVSTVTDINGVATAPTLKANDIQGDWQATATPNSNPGIEVNFDLSILHVDPTPVLTTITIVSGNNQKLPSSGTSAPITAGFYDQFGHPLIGYAVKARLPFSTLITFPGGAPFVTGFTNSLGQFSVQVVTHSWSVDEETIVDVTFSQNVPFPVLTTDAQIEVIDETVPVRIVAISGLDQHATVSTAFPLPLIARVLNALDQGLSGVTVRFAAPISGASCVLQTQDKVTNASGDATTATLTANATVGAYVVNTTIPAEPTISTLTFGLTNASTSGPDAQETLMHCEA